MDTNEANYDAADLQLIAAMRRFTLSQTNSEQLAEGDKRNSTSPGLALLGLVLFLAMLWGVAFLQSRLIGDSALLGFTAITVLYYLKSRKLLLGAHGIRKSLGLTRKKATGLIPGDFARSYMPYWQNLLPGISADRFHFAYCYSFFNPHAEVPYFLKDDPYRAPREGREAYKELFVLARCGGAPTFNEIATKVDMPSTRLLEWLGPQGTSALEKLREDLIVVFVDGNIVVSGYGDESDIWQKNLSSLDSWRFFTETVSGPMADLVEALVLTRGSMTAEK